MGITKEKFVELVDKDSIGFILHMFCDGEEWALGTTSLKKEPQKAILRALRAMMCTMNAKEFINLGEHKELDKEISEIVVE